MTPIDYYRAQAAKGLITSDPKQLVVLEIFAELQQNLIEENDKRAGRLRLLHKTRLVQGIYLWGGVGIGKTFLMDCFFHSLPFENKIRMHFHKFMRLVHEKLKQHQGEQDPLVAIAKEFAKSAIVLCFDEFFITDITDAMLLGRLIKALFDNGLTLVATSNIAPDVLYKNGLQRSRFLPAIQLLKTETTVLHLPIEIDYRLRHLQKAGVFYTPLDESARQNMEKNFSVLTQGKKVLATPLTICGRSVNVIKRAEDNSVVWFDFKEICTVPRSQQDYLAIAEKFKTVMISDIPNIAVNEKDTISLFINMVDVFYDARTRLVISAAEPIEQIYSRGYMAKEYTRTNSRLEEMQSVDYFTDEYSRDNTNDV
jgi:cell division protein ZapE